MTPDDVVSGDDLFVYSIFIYIFQGVLLLDVTLIFSKMTNLVDIFSQLFVKHLILGLHVSSQKS